MQSQRASSRLAIFSDSNGHLDGISVWCQRFIQQSQRLGFEVLLPTCYADNCPAKAEVYFPALLSMRMPFYSHMQLNVLSPRRVVTWMQRAKVSHVELATPGTMGLLGLLAARRLGLPVTATFHTNVPGLLTTFAGGDRVMPVVKRYLRWFYNHVDRTFALTSGALETLRQIGVAPSGLRLLPFAIDPDEFSPLRRDPTVFSDLGCHTEGRPVVLAAGRLSAEKRIPLLIEATARLQSRRQPPVLLVAGDGPMRKEWQTRYQSATHVRWLGAVQGEVLARLYASSDAFVFGSTVDTLGLTVFEALASGTPVLLCEQANAWQFLRREVHALSFSPTKEQLSSTLAHALDNPMLLSRLANAGRAYAVGRWHAVSFARIWDQYVPPSRAVPQSA